MKRIVVATLVLTLWACSNETDISKSDGVRKALNLSGRDSSGTTASFGCPKGTHAAGNAGSVNVRCTESVSKGCEGDAPSTLWCRYKVGFTIEGSCPAGSFLEREPKCGAPQADDWLARMENKNYCQQLQGDYTCKPPRTTGPPTSFLCLNCVPDAPQPPISNDPEDPNTPPNPPSDPVPPQPPSDPNPPKPPPTREECRAEYDKCIGAANAAYEACSKKVAHDQFDCEQRCGENNQPCIAACAKTAERAMKVCESNKEDAVKQCDANYKDCFSKAASGTQY